MAFDHGSHSLGIKNPFKLYGFMRSVTGLLLTLLAANFIWQSLQLLKEDGISGGIILFFSLVLLAGGISTLGSGIFQLLRFFVGRSVPVSLATNFSETERHSASEEKHLTAYDEQTLKSMLMGRKNVTFEEPAGWTSRLVHTIFPRLLFLPVPIRNLVQRLASAILTSLTLAVAFMVSWVVVSSGVVGDAGSLVLSAFSVLLVSYLALTWFKLQRPLNRKAERSVESLGSGKFIFLIATAIIVPIGLGIAINTAASSGANIDRILAQVYGLVNDDFVGFSAWPLLGILVACCVAICVPVITMITQRTNQVDARTEVSEYRDHWQETIHPKELFINLDNMILANRRYKEMPNRVYSEFNPEIHQQGEKGSFAGELLIETQPAFKPNDQSSGFKTTKLMALLLSQLFILGAGGLFIYLAYTIIDSVEAIRAMAEQASNGGLSQRNVATWFTPVANGIVTTLTGFFIWRMLKSFGLSLEQFTKWMYAELRFESLLMFFKCEGTYIESKLATGMSIHDSTRSENLVVKTNFTPWVITSRVVTNTFAQEGAQNIEHERHVMTMSGNKEEMDTIIGEMREFLDSRESLAKVSSEKDLAGISTIHAINQQTRAATEQQSSQQAAQAAVTQVSDEEVGGFIRNNGHPEDQ